MVVLAGTAVRVNCALMLGAVAPFSVLFRRGRRARGVGAGALFKLAISLFTCQFINRLISIIDGLRRWSNITRTCF